MTNMSKRWWSALLSLLLALVLLTGCSEDDPVVPAPEPTGLPFPDSPEQLMENFQTAYETRDAVELARLLHPQAETILLQSTTNWYPDVGTTLDRAEELRIHERMFSGVPVTDPLNRQVPAIEHIEWQTFAWHGFWTGTTAGDPIPNAQWALYDVVVLFDRGQMFSMLKTQGTIKFHITHRDSVRNGVTRPFYQIRAQTDLTYDMKARGSETIAWGRVKAMFR